jgi:hypothetical protein
MITQSTVRNVSKIGDVVEASYTIEDSAKIFSILRSNIYSDKILAVVREYSTNGWDGHILNGTPDRPLQITLPTSLSPVFKVRDFGVGLSEESVMHIYTSYGTSTKDSSNDFNGTFGLGSKSAFAYGNTFGITSYFNGVKTLYTAYLDETNIGKIRKEYSEPTSEVNGVEIEIAVKSADIRQFNETASNFYKHFQPTPDFLGGDGTVVNALETFGKSVLMFEGSDFSIKNNEGSPYWMREKSVAIMGNVAYPLSVEALGWGDSRADLLTKACVILQIPIGAVSITASREALEYDKRTKDYLIGRICQMHSEILKKTQDTVDSCDSFWEAATLLNSLRNLDRAISDKVTFGKWKNIRYTCSSGYYSGFAVMLDDKFVRDEICGKYDVSMKQYSYFSSPRLTGYRVTQLTPDNKTVFVFNRPGKVKKDEVAWRVRGAYRKHSHLSERVQIILVDFDGKDTSDEMLKGILKGAITDNLEDCDIVKYQSNRSATPRKYSTNTDLAKTKIFSFNRGKDSQTKSNNWDAVSNDEILNGGGVYVTINGYDRADSSRVNNMDAVESVLKMLENAGISIRPVYGIRDSVKKIGDGWVKFDNWVVDTVNDHIELYGLADDLAECIEAVNSIFIGGKRFMPVKNGVDLIDFMLSPDFPACDLKDFALRLNRMQTTNSLINLYNLKNNFESIKVGETDIQSVFSALKDKYAGLALIISNTSYSSMDDKRTEFIRYVEHFNKAEESNYFRVVM